MSVDPDFIEHCYDGSKDFAAPAIKATFEAMIPIMEYDQDGWIAPPV